MKILKLSKVGNEIKDGKIIQFPKQEKTEIINKKRGVIGKIIQFPNINTDDSFDPDGGGGMALAA